MVLCHLGVLPATRLLPGLPVLPALLPAPAAPFHRSGCPPPPRGLRGPRVPLSDLCPPPPASHRALPQSLSHLQALWAGRGSSVLDIFGAASFQ